MRTFRRAVATALCSTMLALASVPSVSMADMLPAIDFPEDVSRLAMPHVDESQLIDDGSLYYDVITEANESGESARSVDYAYGAIAVDDETGIDAWVPIRRIDGAAGELVYDETWVLYMNCEVSIAEVPKERREPSSSMFDPIGVQLLDEDGNRIEDRVPMDAEEAMDGPEVDRTFRFGGGHVVTIPTGRYVLRVTEGRRPAGDIIREVTFLVDESKDFVIIDENKGLGAGPNELDGDRHSRTLCQWDYPSGAVFTANMWVEPAEVRYEHTEVLYDPTEEDEEFTAGLAKQFPDGFTAGEAEHAWTKLLWSRAYKELNPTPAGDSNAHRPLPSATGVQTRSGNDASLGIAIVVAIVLAGTIVTLVVVTRRRGANSSVPNPSFDDYRHDTR